MEKELLEKIEEVAENEGWVVTDEGETLLFSKCSPAGQDFNFSISTEDLETTEDVEEAIYEEYNNFDVSYETYLWLDNTGHGKNGAPYNMKDLYEDMEACENMIYDLSRAFLFNV